MITIRSAAGQSAHVILPFRTVESFGPSQGWKAGNMVICPHYGSSLAVNTYDIPSGHLSYLSDKRWGRLRDREVLHHSAQGTIDVSALTLSKTPHAAPAYGPGYVMRGSSQIPFGQTLLWGESLVTQYHLTMPGWYDTVSRQSNGFRYNCMSYRSTRGINSAWLFDQDFAFACISGSETVKWWVTGTPSEVRDNYGAAPAPEMFGERPWLILRRVVNGSYVFKQYVMAYVAGSFCLYVGPDGKTYNIYNINGCYDQFGSSPGVPIDHSYWSQYESAFTTMNSSYIAEYSELATITDPVFEANVATVAAAVQEKISLGLMFRHGVDNPAPNEFAAMTPEILDQHRRVDSNILLTIFELATLRLDSIPWRDFTKLVTNASSAMKNGLTSIAALREFISHLAKHGSGVFLGVQYGVLPTASDVKKVAAACADVIEELYSKIPPARLHTRHTTTQTPTEASPITTVETLTVEVDQLPRDFLGWATEIVRCLWSWGLWPSLEMAWDFIPFSFVVGWISGLDEYVESWDYQIWKEYYPIQYCILSQHREWTVSGNDLWPELGLPDHSIKLSVYQRWCEHDLPIPPISARNENGPFDHWAESSALIFQRMRLK